MRTKKEIYAEHVHSQLLVRQRLFIAITGVLLIISTRNLIRYHFNGWLALSGFLLSIFIGLLFSRIFNIQWDKEEERVVSKLDAFGVILLVVYIGLDFVRSQIFKHWLSDTMLSTFGLIFLTGLLLGRFLGITKRIRALLLHHKKLT